MSSHIKHLLQPIQVGKHTLKNRIAMAPMTRSRATNDGVVQDITATYYAQRSNAGLIITEGIYASPMGKGYTRTPGLTNDQEVAAWKHVTDSVHKNGGKIFAQIMECGRISHSSLLPNNAQPIAPSAIKANGHTWIDSVGMAAHPEPRALETSEIADVIDGFKKATERAIRAGFDGVEVHAASGYLPNQFLSTSANTRTDKYGGSVQNRARFVLETLEAMTSVAGSDYVGIKISPGMKFNDMNDDIESVQQQYKYLVEQLNALKLAYLHVGQYTNEFDVHQYFKPLYQGLYIAGGGFTRERGEDYLSQNKADMIAYGQLYISNPDLVKKFENNIELAKADPSLFYVGGEKGYIDYPESSQ